MTTFQAITGNLLAQPQSGELGVFPLIPVAIGAGSLLLGGGYLWTRHEQHTEVDRYHSCLEEYTTAPYNMDPAEAGLVCSGEAKHIGFRLGFNTPTFIIAGSAAFAIWLALRTLTRR